MGENSGWFDAFREYGGPTWYGDNRTGVLVDIRTVSISVLFCVVFAAFLIVLPGIRREKWNSLLAITMSFYIGAVTLVTIYHPAWQTGSVNINTAYRAFSDDMLDARLGIKIGLSHVNITLKGSSGPEGSESHMDYNEQFYFSEVRSMQQELRQALRRGLPYPMLTVVNYLSADQAGFVWGRQYRLAGYYSYIMLWLAFALWVLSILLMCLVPKYYSRSVIGVGLVLMLVIVTYGLAAPRHLKIPFPGHSASVVTLKCRFGVCYWLVLSTSLVAIIVGAVMRVLELRKLYKFATFLQSDEPEHESAPYNGPGSYTGQALVGAATHGQQLLGVSLGKARTGLTVTAPTPPHGAMSIPLQSLKDLDAANVSSLSYKSLGGDLEPMPSSTGQISKSSENLNTSTVVSAAGIAHPAIAPVKMRYRTESFDHDSKKRQSNTAHQV